MATDMVDAFSTVADEVRSWQINFGDEISDLLEDIGAKIKEINEIIKQANEMGK
jgi:methyl-accepting chemotaxis protein